MTDQPGRDIERDFEREERAFRTALAARAEDCEPVDLAVPAPRVRRGGWRRPWHQLGVAAAALALIGGVVAIVLADRPDDVYTRPDAQPGPAIQTLPDPADGMRWVSRYDVTVQVPASWTDAKPPLRPDCISKPGGSWDDAPRHPYVAVDTYMRGVPSIGCMGKRSFPGMFGQLPFSLWEPYLSFDPASGSGAPPTKRPDGRWVYRGWTLTRWRVSGVQISLLTAPGQDALASRIRASATTFDADQNGCPAVAPMPAKSFARPRHVETGAVGSVSECAYGLTRRRLLIGSRTITGGAARSLLQAIDAAPAGGGPDDPADCLYHDPGETAIVLRAHGDRGTQDLYVYFDECDGHGIDDGRVKHALTRADCRPLFKDAVITFWGGQGEVADRCWPGSD